MGSPEKRTAPHSTNTLSTSREPRRRIPPGVSLSLASPPLPSPSLFGNSSKNLRNKGRLIAFHYRCLTFCPSQRPKKKSLIPTGAEIRTCLGGKKGKSHKIPSFWIKFFCFNLFSHQRQACFILVGIIEETIHARNLVYFNFQ